MEFIARVLVGATAVGKSAVAQYIAERDASQIISADAMLIYRGMDIGTAKPSKAEREKVTYFCVDCAEPSEKFNVFSWFEQIRAVGNFVKPPIIVGGTGLYVSALLKGYDFNGKDSAKVEAPRIPCLRIERAERRRRIEKRAREMFETGLVEEATSLNISGTASAAIGYKEALEVAAGKLTREEAIARVTTRTCQFAKRQDTWFRTQLNVEYIDIDSETPLEVVVERVISAWKNLPPVLVKL